MIIRPATHDDIPCLRRYERDLIEVERAFDPDLLPDGLTYYDVKALIENEDSQLLVAASNDSILACGYVQIRDAKPIYHHKKVAYVGFLYVAPDARGRGLVQQIIDKLIEWSRSRGLSHIELGVYRENTGAISAYQRAGFETIAQTMVKRLDD